MPRPVASVGLEGAILSFIELNNQIDTLEEQLKDLKALRKQIGEVDLTMLVQQDGVRQSGVTLSDGTEYTFDYKMTCGIKTADKPAAFQWLAEHKADGMIKRRLVLVFGKNATAQVAEARKLLARILPEYEIGIKVGKAPLELVDALRTMLVAAGLWNVEIEEEDHIEGATLAAFARKCLVTGVNLPAEFGVYAPIIPTKVQPSPADADVKSAPQPMREERTL
jgi:hypothetical protein